MTFKRRCINIIKAVYPGAEVSTGYTTNNLTYVEARQLDKPPVRIYDKTYERLYQKLLTITFEG